MLNLFDEYSANLHNPHHDLTNSSEIASNPSGTGRQDKM